MSALEICGVRPEDLAWVVEIFTAQVYPDDPDAAREHFADHADGGGASFLAFVQSRFAGYVTIRWQSRNPLFRQANIPLIHDLLVFSAYRRRAIASRLMDAAEDLIASRTSTAGITVGLFDAYGPAQRPLRTGETVTMDHDLILWLTKDVSGHDDSREEVI